MFEGMDIGALIFCYLLFVNAAGVLIVYGDKRAAKKRARRVPEKTLFFVAAVGGAPAVYLAMRKIRHKTLHKRFMIGLPLMILAQVILLAALAVLGYQKAL